MGNQGAINVVCATSHEYLYPTGIMIASLKDCLPRKSKIRVFVFCTEDVEPLVNSHLGLLRNSHFSIDLVRIDSILEKFDDWFKCIFEKNERRSFNSLAGAKLMAYKLLPGNITKVIWLDSDLVIRSDISDLWNAMPGDAVAGAVQDGNIPTAGKRWDTQVNLLGLQKSETYFNSGVLLIDLLKYPKYINEEMIDHLLNKFPSQYKPSLFRYYDQDFLNYLLSGKIYSIDPQWNQTKRKSIGWKDILLRSDMIAKRPHIQHYPHVDKPWLWKTSTVESAYFYEAAQKAPWPNKYTKARWSMVVLYALARSPLRKFYRFIKNQN